MSLKVNGAAPDASAALADGQPAENEADDHPSANRQPDPIATSLQRQQRKQSQRHNKPIRLKNHANCGEIYDTLHRLAYAVSNNERFTLIFLVSL